MTQPTDINEEPHLTAHNIIPSSDTALTTRGQFDVMEKFFRSEEAKELFS